MQANYVQRMRFVFRKEGPARFISHLDLARALERALNRAQIPTAYTQGFNRRPRMQFASALALGQTSSCEVADVLLRERMEPADFHQQLMSRMAPGIVVEAVSEVPIEGASLQALSRSATYEVTPLDPWDEDELLGRVAALLAAESWIVLRREKERDLRPLIESLEIRRGEDGQTRLHMRLKILPTQMGRPDDVLEALGLDPLDTLIHRTELALAGE